MHEEHMKQVIVSMVNRSAMQIAEGKSKKEVIAGLISEGCPSELAVQIADKADEVKRSEFRKGGQTTMLIGAGIFGVGLAITMGTYQAAASNGGHYAIFYGAMLVGGWIFLKGLWRTLVG